MGRRGDATQVGPDEQPAIRASMAFDGFGHSLLGIAARHDNAEVAQLLVTEWKSLPAGKRRDSLSGPPLKESTPNGVVSTGVSK